MKFFKFKNISKRNNLYFKIFFALILSIVITLFVSSTILYINFENIALNQVYVSDSRSLLETSRNVSIMAKTTTMLSIQIFQDSTIQKLLDLSSFDNTDIIPSLNQLDNYRMSMPFIESIYVYNAKEKTFFISSDLHHNRIQYINEFEDKGVIDFVKNNNSYKPFYPIPRKRTLSDNRGDTELNCYTLICYDLLNNKNAEKNAIIVNISEEWIHNVADNVSDLSNNDTFIIDNNGLVASRSKLYPILSRLPDENLSKVLKSNPLSSGYLLASISGKKSLITYTAPDSLGWRYVRITPFSFVTKKIEDMKTKTITICFSLLLLGLFISYILMRKLYLPIDSIVKNINNLETERRNNFNILKQEFLRNFVLNRESDGGRPEEQFCHFGIKLDFNSNILLILIKIDSFSQFCQNNKSNDQNLFKFAIMNIACELCSMYYITEAVAMENDRLLLILNLPNNVLESNDDSFTELLKSIQSKVFNHLNISLSLTVSTIEPNAARISSLYNEVLEASIHRLFYGHKCIIFSKDIIEFKSRVYSYPNSKEKLLTDNLMTGKISETKSIYWEIISETASYPYTAVNLAISHLIFTINNIINVLEKNNSLLNNDYLSSVFISLNNVEIIEEINNHFFKLFEEIIDKMEDKKNSRYEDLIDKINNIINLNYMDPNLSLNSIAETMDMSPVYVGRLYKQYTFKTMIDYITEVRINKAKELLLENKYSVSQISDKTGFTNSSYFYKVFKKLHGVTPNDYKKNSI